MLHVCVFLFFNRLFCLLSPLSVVTIHTDWRTERERGNWSHCSNGWWSMDEMRFGPAAVRKYWVAGATTRKMGRRHQAVPDKNEWYHMEKLAPNGKSLRNMDRFWKGLLSMTTATILCTTQTKPFNWYNHNTHILVKLLRRFNFNCLTHMLAIYYIKNHLNSNIFKIDMLLK